MNRIGRTATISFAVCVFCALFGVIQPSSANAPGFSIGPGVRLYPEIELEWVYTDNFYRTHDHEVSAFGYRIKPELTLIFKGATSEVQLGVEHEIGRFETSKFDDYEDTRAFINLHYQPLLRHSLQAKFVYKDGHDPFGTNRTQGGVRPNQPLDQWDRIKGKLAYTFGAPGATLNLGTRLTFLSKHYKTNRIQPGPQIGTRFLDRNEIGFGVRARYKIGARTSLVADALYRNIEYENDLPRSLGGSLDGNALTLLVGVNWQASAQTSGGILIGSYSRYFDAPTRADTTGVTWRARVVWTPLSYSKVKLATGQRVVETYLATNANFVDQDFVKLSWNHRWSSRLQTILRSGAIRSHYQGLGRVDDFVFVSAGLEYTFLRLFEVGLKLRHEERGSSAGEFLDYDQNLIVLSLKAVI